MRYDILKIGIVLIGLLGFLLGASQINAQENIQTNTDPVFYHTIRVVSTPPEDARASLQWLVERNNPDVAAHLIAAARFAIIPRSEIFEALGKITDHKADNWFDWMLWQEANRDIKPHETLVAFKTALFSSIDPAFQRFYKPETKFSIRPEEVVWGGVRVDGIPALDNPKFLNADQASYLKDDDEVFAVEINGDARAYPLRIMGWHEMFNDVIGGVPVSLAYCTLCNAGILFEGDYEGSEKFGVTKPFTFGSSGFLYQSNKLMYDRNTDSLWNQFTGQPVAGKLLGSGIELKIRPVIITSWEEWKAEHPDTKVLDIKTGFRRNYGSGIVYKDYFASDQLMFPAIGDVQRRLTKKDEVFGLRLESGTKAWPLDAFAGGKVINNRVGNVNVVLIGDAKTRTVRAYERGDIEFDKDLNGWERTEKALLNSDGRSLNRLPGHVSYWFAWAGYLGDESELFVD